MWSLVVACALTCCGSGPDSDTPAIPPVVVAELGVGLQTGSLIFSRGDCLAVKVLSRSPYTHVGGIVMKNGTAFVYDSMNGVGVRESTFAEYLRQQAPSTIEIVHPTVAFTPTESAAFEHHLQSQLGRKYAVKHHLTGQRCAGVHCAEYMTEALMAAEMISARHPARVSPGSLREGVLTADLYTCGQTSTLPTGEAKPGTSDTEVQGPWYQRAWCNTSECCSQSSAQLRRWVTCR